MAHAEEVADAVRGLRKKGKKVLCHLEDNGGKSLFVCSQADRIAMNPAGGLRYAGLSSTYQYFGGVLKKLDVRADFVRIGAHKLAAEQFTLEHGSDIAKLDHQELVNEIEKVYLHDTAEGRKHAPRKSSRPAWPKAPSSPQRPRSRPARRRWPIEDELDRVVHEVVGEKA
jgi:protease-4